MLDVKIKRLSDTAKIPTKAHPTDACYDIYANIPNERYKIAKSMDITDVYSAFFCGGELTEEGDGIAIEPHCTVKIPTGFATNLPHGYFAAVFARSGLATKQGLRPANCVCVIDEPYTGEWFIPIHNDTNEVKIIKHGDRIAQFTLMPYYDVNFIETNELADTDRGMGGFGSSGV